MKTDHAFRDAGLFLGIIGSLTFVVFILIFLQDWTSRFHYVCYLMPVPVVVMLIANRMPLPGGLLLIFTGLAALVFDLIFSPAHPGQIAGLGLGYTLIFVALPLMVSGVMFLFTWWNGHQSKI